MATSTTEPTLALFAWLSPSYPVGAFAYSHGLEWAIETGDVRNAQTLAGWIESILEFGTGRNDAILFAAAFRALNAGESLGEIAELACALASSSERRLESTQQGAAFLAATCAAWPIETLDGVVRDIGANTAYPVCFAAAAAAHGIALRPALDGYLAAFASNLVSGAVRLSVIGQTAGQGIVARIAPLAARVATMAEHSTLENLGGCAFRADLASLHHETQYARLFRS
ncbi:MAG: urease accessory UreF family protein [Beijerinckiaceae bacterium]|nr:urease accessory UreF family protein [Beijerinckiaceae bacterium]